MNGGATLATASTITLADSSISQNIYVPGAVDASTSAENVSIFKFAHGALSLGRTKSSLASNLADSSKLVESR